MASLFYVVLRLIAPIDDARKLDPQYPIQFALWIAGGIGGVVALVVAYRRQKVTEENIFVERFGAAAAQLGSEDPAVRMAGVYAMAGVADEGNPAQRQQCVDVLCGYLRLPHDSDGDLTGITQLVTKKPGQMPADPSVERTVKYRLHDKEVRATIVRVLASHLRENAANSWSLCEIDLSGAVLIRADFSGCRFGRRVNFTAATFKDDATFTAATFHDDATFTAATFNGYAWFSTATFDGDAWFSTATFKRDAWFPLAAFRAAWFDGATTFKETAWFTGATFKRTAYFNGATFDGYARFSTATFGGQATFDGATFGGEATFDGAAFDGGRSRVDVVSFHGANFGTSEVDFSNPRIWDPAPRFDWDQEPSSKPPNVLPTEWPPAVSDQELNDSEFPRKTPG